MPTTASKSGGSSDPRQKPMKALANQIRACRRCEDWGLNEPGKTEAAPGFGSVRSPVVIVGQSLCGPCMKSQIPFTGGSGKLLEDSLDRAGKFKDQVFITNVVHCHPPRNRKSLPEWKENCTPYLHRELKIVQPSLVIGLGKDAEAALRDYYPKAQSQKQIRPWPFTAPRATGSETSPFLLFAKHPSWIKRQHDDFLEEEYVSSLARAFKWAFRRVSA